VLVNSYADNLVGYQLDALKSTIQLSNYILTRFDALVVEFDDPSYSITVPQAYEMATSAQKRGLAEADIDSWTELTRNLRKR
jgi:hypothetical protein